MVESTWFQSENRHNTHLDAFKKKKVCLVVCLGISSVDTTLNHVEGDGASVMNKAGSTGIKTLLFKHIIYFLSPPQTAN